MGLESHVDSVINTTSPELRPHYFWSNGLKVESLEKAKQICEVLDASGQFGKTSIVNTIVIEFDEWKPKES